MYTLYYLNRNLQLGTIKTQTLDAPILIPEDLIFCDLRKGINFIKEPHECIHFTDIERLIMQSQFNDMDLIKDADFRYQNTYLTPLCPIDLVTLNPETFDFKARTYKDEGSLKLVFAECDFKDLVAKFSIDGIVYTHTFDFAYWDSPEGLEKLEGMGMYDLREEEDSTKNWYWSIYLDRAMRNEEWYNSVPEFKHVYFENKITGKKSPVYLINQED